MQREYFTRYSDNEFVIVAKLFRAPITNYYKNLINLKEDGKFVFNIDFNFKFYLRFYFPKKQLTTINSKTERLIIMFNGLNEVNDVNFSLYDRLGKSFASQGFPAVLFPTPFHLNRSAIDTREFEYNDWEERPKDFPKNKIKTPAIPLAKRPYCLYMNFIQTIHEYTIFRHLIDHEFNKIKRCDTYDIPKVNKEEKYFFNQYFTNKKTEVSLLGYSLGGLYALSCFSKNPERINSCALLNSGASLDQMNLRKFVKREVWKKIANNLRSVKYWGCGKNTQADILNDNNYALINNVFFYNPLEDSITRVGKKLLFIMGGKDEILKPDSVKRLEPEGFALNKFVIGELEHLLFDDVEFNNWYTRLIYIITDFFSETADISISKQESLDCLLSFNGLCNGHLFPNGSNTQYDILRLRNILKDELLKIIKDEQTIDKVVSLFDSIYRVVISHTKDAFYIINRMNLKTNDLLFGKFIVKYCEGHKNKKEIKKLISVLKDFRPEKQKIGAWLIDNKYITVNERNGAIKRQLEAYSEFCETSKVGKQILMPMFQEKISMLNI
ncbi:MAG: hypothetical protein GXO85_00690 [Chlorobi bacterium]|nr:hypothetical protein [Chlorobiota bacterium]